MKVNWTHPEYEASAGEWARARDLLLGEDAVKAAGERYLPRLDTQSEDEFEAYVRRASFFNATARTAEGYVGLIFRRPPFVKVQSEKCKVQNGGGAGKSGTGEPAMDKWQMGQWANGRTGNQNSRGENGGRAIGVSAMGAQTMDQLPMGQWQRGEMATGGEATGLERALSGFVNDADMLGTPLAGYAKDVVWEVIGVGRAGSLVDWEGEVEQRAYVSLYSAEQIINWRVERVNGRNVPTLIVLREKTESRKQKAEIGNETDEEEFEWEVVEQIRVLRLVEGGTDGSYGTDGTHGSGKPDYHYEVEIWVLDDGDQGEGATGDQVEALAGGEGDSQWYGALGVARRTASAKRAREWRLIERIVPLRLGRPLPLIPFVFHGPRHSRPEVDRLPLSDIMAVNLDHYRLDADFKHGLHFTALPTAWVSGFDAESELRIGSSTAWVAKLPGATAGFLEFTGQGLSTFERAMDRDERLMAVLGSRLLEDQKRVGETAQAIELRQSGEHSVLSGIATSVSESLTQVLRWVYWWNSTETVPDAIASGEVLIRLNTDFSTKGMDSRELQAVVAAWQSGAISRDTMFELFRKGEILPDGRTNEEEMERLKAEG